MQRTRKNSYVSVTLNQILKSNTGANPSDNFYRKPNGYKIGHSTAGLIKIINED